MRIPTFYQAVEKQSEHSEKQNFQPYISLTFVIFLKDNLIDISYLPLVQKKHEISEFYTTLRRLFLCCIRKNYSNHT